MRFTLVCWIAMRLPISIVAMATADSRSAHNSGCDGAATSRIRTSDPSAAAFTVTDMNAVVVVGAPS
jgi:hypothetical protein